MFLFSSTAVTLLLPRVLAAGPTPRPWPPPRSVGGGANRADDPWVHRFLAAAADAGKADACLALKLAILGVKKAGRKGGKRGTRRNTRSEE